MKSHDDILERMSEANPLPDVEMITDGQLAAMTLQVEEARRAGLTLDEPQALDPTRPRVRWLRPAIAFGAALLVALATIGVVSLISRGGSDLANEQTPTTTGAPTTTAAPTTSAAPDASGAPAAPISPINRVLDIAIANDNELWAITLGGVVRWDLVTQTHTVHDEELGPGVADFGRVMAGAGGTVWLIGDESLARYDGGWATSQLSDAPFGHLRPGEPVPMAVGPDGALWIAAGPDELGRFDGSEWEIFEAPYAATRVDRGWASDIAVSPDGTVWAALEGMSGEPDPESPALDPSAVASFDGTDWALYTAGDGLPDGVRSITVAPDGTVWAMSFGWAWSGSDGDGSVSGEGIARFDGSTWARYTEADGLPSNSSEIEVGLDGSIWAVDIEGAGISQFDGSGWTALAVPPRFGLPAVVDAAGTLWMPSDESEGGIVGVNGENTFRFIVPVEEGPVAAPDTTVVPATEWNSILADTRAGPTPPAATCLPGTSPNEPGPIDQQRPEAAFNGMLAAAFDHRLGQIIFADTNGQTWGFDVCTNTWHTLNPDGTPPAESSAGLVYDVDSDRTISVGSLIGVYDAESNEWSTAVGKGYPFGAVYDPVSGLVITTIFADDGLGGDGLGGDGLGMELWAYDVDTDTWTLVGHIAQLGDLLGYTPEPDRLIIATWDNRTMLLDPRSGEKTIVETETPAVQFGWPKASYGTTTDTAFVAHGVKAAGGMIVDVFPGFICGFEPATLTWGSCLASPGDGDYPGFGAIVGDPINNRLVVINGIYGDFWVNATDHVWGIDLETGELSELLEPSE